VVSSVGSTDAGRILPSLPLDSHVVNAGTVGSAGVIQDEARECLEVQSELTHIIRCLGDGVLAGAGAGGGVGAGVARVPDVGGVVGDAGSTGAGVDHTADSESSGTVSISTSSLGRALRAGVAGAIGGGGTGTSALLIGELNDGEQGK